MDLSHCSLFNKHLDYFIKPVYFPVHPGFIDILSFELQCHPSNAPQKVEEGIIIVNPCFQRERKQNPSRLNPELVYPASPQLCTPIWPLVKDEGGRERDSYISGFST